LLDAFDWAPGFREFFAVKAAPNPHLLKILSEEGFGADCSSLAELMLSEAVGVTGENIMFSSNETPLEEYKKAIELGAITNLDDIEHVGLIAESLRLPELISFRFNPGPERTGNAIIGNPSEAKFGCTREQLFRGYEEARRQGAKRFGLHTMVVSNELNVDYFVETARMLFLLAGEIHERLGIRLEFVNLGGGLGIPYRPDEFPLDLEGLGEAVRAVYEELIVANGLDPLRIYMENGRFITGPFGYLVSTVLHKKNTYKKYVGLDACMANLMRPGMYGAYHQVSVLGKEAAPAEETYDVVGSLCENNDKFAIDRKLPRIDVGDLVLIHDAGAHGHAMGFNYNGKLRSSELLLKEDGSVELIRRRETLKDLFSTLHFPGL
ncbi:MAG: diaminopimelate decarboxylase, partial [Planctomycetes bacterium]|nr:diaminopimelate decarboxylase [Planctomycetota bacterium]